MEPLTLQKLLTKLASRKFLLALATAIVAVIAIFKPDAEGQMLDGAERIVGLVVLVLAALGYGVAEAIVDKARASNPPAESETKPNDQP